MKNNTFIKIELSNITKHITSFFSKLHDGNLLCILYSIVLIPYIIFIIYYYDDYEFMIKNKSLKTENLIQAILHTI